MANARRGRGAALRGRAAAALASVLALGMALVTCCPAARALDVPPPGPTARADVSSARVGALVHLNGAGWGADIYEVVRVVLCGNGALDGVADCDLTNTAEGGIAGDGTFHATFTVRAPILPCPCVLRLSSEPGNVTVALPIMVLDAPTASPVARVVVRRAVAFGRIAVTGGGPWTAWFGGRPSRTVELRMVNTGTVPLQSVALDVRWGRGARPNGFIDAPPVADLLPGRSATLRFRIPTSALSFGRYTVVAHADPLGPVATAEAIYATYPFGLLVLLCVGVIAVGATLAVRAHRRRRTVHGGTADAAETPAAGWYPDPVGVGRLRGWDGAAWREDTRPAPDQREKRRRRRRAAAWSSASHGRTGSPVGGGA